jgi:eukaryotic-like serine/threonine-protein kinase
MDTTLARPPIGQLLDGRYRVESHLARGGMATVYLGTDTRLDRTVALKIMHAELANDEEFVRRFVAEARSVARLAHPNVVTVYDQGADGRTLFLAMEYVPGRTLRDLLRERTRLSPREALDISGGVLAGLGAAHRAGIVHRDVKPENVLLGEADAVKVADFGVARLLRGASNTKSGTLIGTAAYLAPEQVTTGWVDARTDVYAFGIMLFEMLTGCQPYTGDSPLAVAHRHVSEVVPPPSSLVPGLPPALDALVALATSRDPDLRPPDAGQFLRAITSVRSGHPLVPPARGPEQRTLPREQPTVAREPAQEQPTIPPAPWQPEQRERRPAPGLPADLIPGLTRPATRQPPGPPRGTTPGPAVQRLPPDEPQQPQTHKTLIVGGGVPFGDAAPPLYREPREHGQPREPRLQRLLFSRRLALVAVGFVLLVAAGLVGWWLTSGRYVTVPRIAGMPAAIARGELRNVGLTASFGKPQLDNKVAKGEVIRSDPAPGSRVPRGGHVTLILSAGPHMSDMPQVTGQPLAAAEAAIRRAGLTPGQVRHEVSDTIPVGVVIDTSPTAGTSWPQPKPVTLTVSAGPPVPNFVGQPKTAAEQWTTANGVQLNEVTARKSTQPAGTVLHQSVKAGSAFTKGQVITIVISPGPQLVNIPNVDGMRVQQAVRVLERLGFKVQVNQVGPFNTVSGFSPTGQAPQGSTITLFTGIPGVGG